MNKSIHRVIPLPWSALAGLLSLPLPLASQCALQVAPGDGTPGTSGPVYASQLWDPDGSGPLSQHLLVAGEFAVAGNLNANGVAAYDLVNGEWRSFDDGSWAARRVLTVVDAGNGELFAAGLSGTTTEVRRWNGTNWLPVGGIGAFASPATSRIEALLLQSNGDLIAAGEFTTVQGVLCNNIARWDGSSWQPLGSGTGGAIEGLAVLPNGDLVAGGLFSTAGGAPANNCARWDGTSWSDFGAGLVGPLTTIKMLASGDLLSGSLGGPLQSSVQRWSGSSWQPLGTITAHIESMGQLANGNPVVGTINGFALEWTGSSWQALFQLGNAPVSTITALPNGHVVVGGRFQAQLPPTASQSLPSYLGRWDGANWQRFGRGFDRPVIKVLQLRSGEVLAGGWFTHVGVQQGSGFARFDGSAWLPVGDHGGAIVWDIAELATGEIFSLSGSLRRFDGANWQIVEGSTAECIEVVRDGRLIAFASGEFVAWSAGGWQSLSGLINGTVTDVELLPNGDLVACGSFDLNGPGTVSLVLWNGTAWTQLADFNTQCSVLEPVAGGVLVAGSFTQIGGIAANHIARYDGVGFSPLGAGLSSSVRDLTTLPDGTVVAAHDLISNFGPGAVSRWNGTTWTALQFAESIVSSLSFGRRGLAIGGAFESFGIAPTPYFALLETPCPAPVLAYGTGCAGSGGLDRLQVEAPAWAGSTTVTTATGSPSSALVVGVTGLGLQSLPLPLVLPLALPGCTLAATPDLLQVAVPMAGRAAFSLAIPPAPSLVGMMLFQQAVTFELTQFGSLTSVTSSNGLRLTIGSF